MLLEYELFKLTFFKTLKDRGVRQSLAPSDDIVAWEGWNSALCASVWLNRYFSQSTATALLDTARQHGVIKTVRSGDILTNEGDDGSMAILLDGAISVAVQAEDEMLTAMRLRSGSIFFLVSLLKHFVARHNPGAMDNERAVSNMHVIRAVQDSRYVLIPSHAIDGLMDGLADMRNFVATQVFLSTGYLASLGTALRDMHRTQFHLLQAYETVDKDMPHDNMERLWLPKELSRPESWLKLIRNARISHALEFEDINLMCQISAPYQCTAANKERYLSGSAPTNKVGFILSGVADVFLPADKDDAESFVTQHGPGSIFGSEQVALPSERAHTGLRPDAKDPFDVFEVEPPHNRFNVYLHSGSLLLEQDWRALRWLLYEKKQIWARACAYLGNRSRTKLAERPKLFVFYGRARTGLTTLAHGAAVATALAESQELEAGEEGIAPVCLIDQQAHTEALERLRHQSIHLRSDGARFDEGELMKADLRDGESDDFTYESHTMRFFNGGLMDMVTCPDIHRTDEVVRWFMEQNRTRYIIVAVDHTRLLAKNSDGEATRAMARRLNSLRPTVVWVTDGPEDVYDFTEEHPLAMIRAEVLKTNFIKTERKRVRELMIDGLRPEDAVRPSASCDHPRHILRVPWDSPGFNSFAHGELETFFKEQSPLAQCFERLGRMIRGRTVGVALGGGGAWGFSHISLLRQLIDQGLPIDYISGTSFGSLVAGLYAAGGLPALEKLLEWSDLPASMANQRDTNELVKVLQNIMCSRLTLRATVSVYDSRHLRYLVDDILREFLGNAHKGHKDDKRTPLWVRAVRKAVTSFAPDHVSDHDVHHAITEPLRDLLVDREVGAVHKADPVEGTMVMAETLTPFLPVGTDISSLYKGEQVFYRGTVGLGMQAASCLPPVYRTLQLGNVRMCDGAFVAFVPTSATSMQGADFVISSNVIPTDSTLLRQLQFRASEENRETPTDNAPRNLKDLWDDSIQRVIDAVQGFYLMAWKAGQDQGRVHGNYVVDMQPQKYDVMEFWRGREIVKDYENLIDKRGLARNIVDLWHNPQDWGNDDAWYARLLYTKEDNNDQ